MSKGGNGQPDLAWNAFLRDGFLPGTANAEVETASFNVGGAVGLPQGAARRRSVPRRARRRHGGRAHFRLQGGRRPLRQQRLAPGDAAPHHQDLLGQRGADESRHRQEARREQAGVRRASQRRVRGRRLHCQRLRRDRGARRRQDQGPGARLARPRGQLGLHRARLRPPQGGPRGPQHRLRRLPAAHRQDDVFRHGRQGHAGRRDLPARHDAAASGDGRPQPRARVAHRDFTSKKPVSTTRASVPSWR